MTIKGTLQLGNILIIPTRTISSSSLWIWITDVLTQNHVVQTRQRLTWFTTKRVLKLSNLRDSSINNIVFIQVSTTSLSCSSASLNVQLLDGVQRLHPSHSETPLFALVNASHELLQKKCTSGGGGGVALSPNHHFSNHEVQEFEI